jgi:hypothetical protein
MVEGSGVWDAKVYFIGRNGVRFSRFIGLRVQDLEIRR